MARGNQLSITPKVFTRIIFIRIEKAVESRLREQQVGFRKGNRAQNRPFYYGALSSSALNDNQLSNLISSTSKRLLTVYIHRETMWRILRLYGAPEKIIRVIQALYNDFICSVFLILSVQPRVKQGPMLSPQLFLTVLDWFMKETTEDN